MADTTELTIEDLQQELTAQDYDTLTLGDEVAATRALLKAKLFVKGMVLSTGHEYREADEVCREATLKYAQYELFAFVGEEARAKEKLADCQLLIETYYGQILKKTDAEGTGAVTGALHTRRKSPMERPRER